ncbi:MAG: SH3 domain-containing protein [Fischerella sp.]|nr:SH3 domain-containing protein [Fischerella sp.]
MLKILMASALVLAVASPVKAHVKPGMVATERLATRERYYARVCTRDRYSRLNLRTGPGQDYDIIMKIPNGSTVVLLYRKHSYDGFYWWKIRYMGNQGWVRADYLCGAY